MLPLEPADHPDNITTAVMKQLASNSFFIKEGEDLEPSCNTGLNSSVVLSLNTLNPCNYWLGCSPMGRVILVPWAHGPPFQFIPLLNSSMSTSRTWSPLFIIAFEKVWLWHSPHHCKGFCRAVSKLHTSLSSIMIAVQRHLASSSKYTFISKYYYWCNIFCGFASLIRCTLSFSCFLTLPLLQLIHKIFWIYFSSNWTLCPDLLIHYLVFWSNMPLRNKIIYIVWSPSAWSERESLKCALLLEHKVVTAKKSSLCIPHKR